MSKDVFVSLAYSRPGIVSAVTFSRFSMTGMKRSKPAYEASTVTLSEKDDLGNRMKLKNAMAELIDVQDFWFSDSEVDGRNFKELLATYKIQFNKKSRVYCYQEYKTVFPDTKQHLPRSKRPGILPYWYLIQNIQHLYSSYKFTSSGIAA
jgi:hypothetical protein